MLIPHCYKQVSHFIYSYTSRLPYVLLNQSHMYRKVDKAILPVHVFWEIFTPKFR